MNKIFKKSLALTVSAALCLTAFIGCLSVSAETVTPVVGNITIGSTEVQVGSTDEFTLPVTIKKGTSNGIAAARFAFSVPSQLEFLGAVKTDNHCIPAWSNNGDAPVTVGGEYIVIAEATNNGTSVDVATFDSGTFNLRFKLAAGAPAGTYSLTMSTKYHEACDTGTLSTDGSYGAETLFDLAAQASTSFGQVVVKASAEATVDLYIGEELKNSINFDTLSAALKAAADYAFEEVNGEFYAPVVRLNRDIVLTEDVDVPVDVKLSLGNSSVECGEYSLNMISTGVITSSYKISNYDGNPFVSETSTDAGYTYSNVTQMIVSEASLTLTNQIFINLSGENLSDSVDGAEYGMEYTKGNSASKSVVSAVYTNGNVAASTKGIPAKEMNDIISARFFAKKAVGGKDYYVYSDSTNYSIVQYAKSILNDSTSSEKAVSLMKNMLNYGSQAQLYFGYETSNLANSILSADDRVIVKNADNMIACDVCPDTECTATGFAETASLVLMDAVDIKIYMSDIIDGAQYKLLVWNSKEYHELVSSGMTDAQIDAALTADNCQNVLDMDASSSTFTVQGIAAKKFADTYYLRAVEIIDGQYNYDFAFSYSVLEWAKSEKNTDFAYSIANYCKAARDYFGGYVINSCVN